MVEITTLANQLNKDHDYVMKLCEDKGIEIQYDSQGCWIYDCDAEQLLQQETDFDYDKWYNDTLNDMVDALLEDKCEPIKSTFTEICHKLIGLYKSDNITNDLQEISNLIEELKDYED